LSERTTELQQSFIYFLDKLFPKWFGLYSAVIGGVWHTAWIMTAWFTLVVFCITKNNKVDPGQILLYISALWRHWSYDSELVW